jgi:hypothetical protein
MSLPIINNMAKKIRALSKARLSSYTKILAATARVNNTLVSTTTVCRCPEAEDGEHECPAFDYLQEQAKKLILRTENL